VPTPQKIALRGRIILLAHQGWANHSIAQQLGISRPTVIAMRAAFAAQHMEAVTGIRKRKRQAKVLTAELEQKIVDATLKSRPGDGSTHWSVRMLARQLGIGRTMVHRVWQRHDIQPHRVERFKLSKDPQFEAKVRDIVGLYLNPPDRALVLCVDEKSQIQALDRTAPLLPLRSGLPERQTHDYKRHGTTLLAAFNILNGKVLGACQPRHRARKFVRFLNRLESYGAGVRPARVGEVRSQKSPFCDWQYRFSEHRVAAREHPPPLRWSASAPISTGALN